jgi:lysophospholipase L1-like esterase
LFYGANDACQPGTRQHVDQAVYASNLRKLIDLIWQFQPSAKIILITPPPVNEYSRGDRERLANSTRSYATVAKLVGAGLKLGLAMSDNRDKFEIVDAWSLFMDYALQFENPDSKARAELGQTSEDGPVLGSRELPESQGLRKLLIDGLHFTEEGYALLRTTIKIRIAQKWPELDAEKMDYLFPNWENAPKEEPEMDAMGRMIVSLNNLTERLHRS